MRIRNHSFKRTEMAEFERWLNSIDFSDGYTRSKTVVTQKGAFAVKVAPILIDGKPVVFEQDAMS
ncbi:hypothetical protein [Agrobacterium vitis]|uniref:hypothetical protein n=1 Tax=Agrobacterium vitis TaxID=373 RepID=UPI0012E98EB5|nr:hypothetical protein [Agrobacterium vitis]MUZ64142.1 hypothetical protein [Agrobacterium vitis]